MKDFRHKVSRTLFSICLQNVLLVYLIIKKHRGNKINKIFNPPNTNKFNKLAEIYYESVSRKVTQRFLHVFIN